MIKLVFLLLIGFIGVPLGIMVFYWHQYALESVIKLGMVLLAFFPIIIGLIWLHERENYSP